MAMKNTMLILMLIVAISCGVKKSKVLPPDTEITRENASQVSDFDNTPESVVMFFYASMIRRDKAWEKVCPTEQMQTKMFRGKMEEYGSWIFNKYHFVKKEEFEKDSYYVTIYMAITFKGEEGDGTDQVTVKKIGGKWKVIDIPT
jgi:hypothetical protein